MKERFHDGLDSAALHELIQARRDGPGLWHTAIDTLLLVVTGALVVLAPSPWLLAAAVVVHGLAHVPFFGMLHETSHGTAFRTSWLNLAAGWLSALTQLSPPGGMRAFHFPHHRHTHELADDPELGGMEMLVHWPRGAFAVANATGLAVLGGRLAFLVLASLNFEAGWNGLLRFVTPSRRAAFTRDARILLLLHGALAVLAGVFAPRLLFFYVAVVVGHGVLSVYLSCEHRGLPMEGTVLERTRSFAGNRFVNWWMWNMPYHAEHHAWPAVPFHQLPRLHALAKERGLLVHEGDTVGGLVLRRGASRDAA